jgi:hypothetical protein
LSLANPDQFSGPAGPVTTARGVVSGIGRGFGEGQDISARNEIAYLNYVSSNGHNPSTSVAARKDRHDLNSGDERE